MVYPYREGFKLQESTVLNEPSRLANVSTSVNKAGLENSRERPGGIFENSRESADEEPVITFSPGRLFSIGKKRWKAESPSFPTFFFPIDKSRLGEKVMTGSSSADSLEFPRILENASRKFSRPTMMHAVADSSG